MISPKDLELVRNRPPGRPKKLSKSAPLKKSKSPRPPVR